MSNGHNATAAFEGWIAKHYQRLPQRLVHFIAQACDNWPEFISRSAEKMRLDPAIMAAQMQALNDTGHLSKAPDAVKFFLSYTNGSITQVFPPDRFDHNAPVARPTEQTPVAPPPQSEPSSPQHPTAMRHSILSELVDMYKGDLAEVIELLPEKMRISLEQLEQLLACQATILDDKGSYTLVAQAGHFLINQQLRQSKTGQVSKPLSLTPNIFRPTTGPKMQKLAVQLRY